MEFSRHLCAVLFWSCSWRLSGRVGVALAPAAGSVCDSGPVPCCDGRDASNTLNGAVRGLALRSASLAWWSGARMVSGRT